MGNIKITCIRLSISGNKFEHITHVGTDKGFMEVESVIRQIEYGVNLFYVVDLDAGDKVDVRVVDGPNQYIRTEKDGKIVNNLLNLPRCN